MICSLACRPVCLLPSWGSAQRGGGGSSDALAGRGKTRSCEENIWFCLASSCARSWKATAVVFKAERILVRFPGIPSQGVLGSRGRILRGALTHSSRDRACCEVSGPRVQLPVLPGGSPVLSRSAQRSTAGVAGLPRKRTVSRGFLGEVLLFL